MNTTPPHTHVKGQMVDPSGPRVLQIYNSQKESRPSNVLDSIVGEMEFTNLTEYYEKHPNEGTEEYSFKGTTIKDGYELTLNLKSCYCTPLNENSEPPF